MDENKIPVGYKRNGFTGELEEAAPLNLAPSPTDQRLLAAPPNDANPETGDIGTPLIDLARERVENDTARNVGEAYIPQQDTVNIDITASVPTQGVNAPAPNTQARVDGAEVAAIETPIAPTAVVSPNALPPADEVQEPAVEPPHSDVTGADESV